MVGASSLPFGGRCGRGFPFLGEALLFSIFQGFLLSSL